MITLYVGPMFSGKTTHLIMIAEKAQVSGKKYIVINHVIDDRYEKTNFIVNHDKHKHPALSVSNLADVDVSDYDLVIVDEGQFFTDIELVETWANMGKDVYVGALNGLHNRKLFGKTHLLFSCADKIHKLSAMCHTCDSKEASFTARLSSEKDEIVVGADIYRAMCRKCHNKHLSAS